MKKSDPHRSLNERHARQILRVAGFPVDSMMHFAMAGRVEGDNELWVVRTPITPFMDVMRFKVRGTVPSEERGGLPAALANAIGSGQHVIPNVARSFVDIPLCTMTWTVYFCRSVGTLAHKIHVHIANWYFCILYDLSNLFDGPELKNDCLAIVAIPIICSLMVPSLADHFPVEQQSTVFLHPEQQKVFTILRMPSDRLVARRHFHVVDLTSSEVLDQAVVVEAIGVSVLFAGGTRRSQNQAMLSGRYDAIALLTSEAQMDVLLPRIKMSSLKSPGHRIFLPFISETVAQPTLSGKGLVA